MKRITAACLYLIEMALNKVLDRPIAKAETTMSVLLASRHRSRGLLALHCLFSQSMAVICIG